MVADLILLRSDPKGTQTTCHACSVLAVLVGDRMILDPDQS